PCLHSAFTFTASKLFFDGRPRVSPTVRCAKHATSGESARITLHHILRPPPRGRYHINIANHCDMLDPASATAMLGSTEHARGTPSVSGARSISCATPNRRVWVTSV